MQDSFEERRKERARRIKKRRLLISFFVFIILAIITLVIMSFTIFFPIKNISVKGSQLYTKKEIISAAEISYGKSIFALSEEKLENKARKVLPYVDDIKIKRKLPDTVILTVTDAKEYATHCVDDTYYVISEKGYVLSENNQKNEELIEIICNGITCETGKTIQFAEEREQELFYKIIRNLEDKNIKINIIDISNNIKIKARVADKFNVNFGTSDNLQQKIAHLAGMIESIGDRSGDIDLSMWNPKNTQGSFVAEVK